MKPGLLITLLCLLAAVPAGAAELDTGPLTLAVAQQAATAVHDQARSDGLPVAVAVVDAGGHPILVLRMDGASILATRVAIAKARFAAESGYPTALTDDLLRDGMLSVLAIDGALPVRGGIPLARDGRVLGAISVSGALPEDDERLARLALQALGIAAEKETADDP